MSFKLSIREEVEENICCVVLCNSPIHKELADMRMRGISEFDADNVTKVVWMRLTVLLAQHQNHIVTLKLIILYRKKTCNGQMDELVMASKFL